MAVDAYLEFPRRLLRDHSHSWNLLGVATTPGQTAQSFSTLVRSDGGGFWKCTMNDIGLSGGRYLYGKDRQRVTTLLWRAVRQLCDGGINTIIVPRNDALFRPWPKGVPQLASMLIPHYDISLFSDGTGYYQPIIDIRSGPGELRATSLALNLNYSGQLIGGESFSIEHPTMGWRLYEISTVTQTSDITAVITFLPPLREAVGTNTYLEFDRPRCLMRLAQTSSMDLTVVPWTFNLASVDFVEAPRPPE
jgi:hypothetical protein